MTWVGHFIGCLGQRGRMRLPVYFLVTRPGKNLGIQPVQALGFYRSSICILYHLGLSAFLYRSRSLRSAFFVLRSVSLFCVLCSAFCVQKSDPARSVGRSIALKELLNARKINLAKAVVAVCHVEASCKRSHRRCGAGFKRRGHCQS